MFALTLLILGQTILGPIGISTVAFADEPDTDEPEVQTASEEIVDKDTLQALLDDFKSKNAEEYEETSYATYVQAINAGQGVFEDADATQDDVNQSVNKIQNALPEKKPEEEPAESPEEDSQEADSTENSGGDAKTDATEENSEEENSEENGSDEVVEENEEANEDEEASEEEDAIRELEDEEIDEYEDKITLEDGAHVESYSFKVKGQEFEEGVTEVHNGDPFEFTINFNKLSSNDMNFGPGTVLEYELPTDFTQHFTGLTVPSSFGEVGTLQIDADTGYVFITLGEGIMEGPTVLDIDNGAFTVSGNFSNTNDDWDKDIAMPGEDKLTVNFKPKQGAGDTVKKSGTAYKGNEASQSKSDRIEWKVTVNTDLASTDDNPQFVDILNAFGQTSGINDAVSQTFDQGSLVVKELNVSPTGDITDGNTVNNPSVNYEDNDTKMTIDLEKGKAYEITYTTTLNDPGAHERVFYTNDAQYNGKSDNDNKSITFGKAIEKSAGNGPGTNLVTDWKITYNGNEREIPANTELTDSWETSGSDQTGKQVIVDDNGDKVTSNFESYITVTNPAGASEPTPNYSVSYDEDKEEFVLTFNDGFDYPVNIEYKTKPEGFTASEDFTVTNTVKHDVNDVTETEKSEYKQTSLTLDKSTNEIDYHNKTMSWKITANQAGYNLDAGAKFEDTFGNGNMTLDEDSLVVKIGSTEYTVANNQGEFTLTNNGEAGFNIELRDTTSEQVEITYTTDYIIKDVDDEARAKDYPNNVVLKGSGLPTDPKDDAQFSIKGEQPVNGSKTGSYDYDTKEFEWKVLVNYNYDTVNGAKFVDKLPEEHAVKEIKVLKGNLLANGNFDSDNADDVTANFDPETNIIDKNEFTLELGNIDQPYYITYTTKMKDDVLPVQEGENYKVKNEAQLLDSNDEPNASWEKEVEVKHSSTVLDEKNGSQVGNTDVIKWNFLYNTAQSKLTNVDITDKFGLDQNETVNQLIDKNSVKVYKAKITNSNTISDNDKKSELLIKDTDYTIDFDQEDATFVLSFDELDHAIYVEYDSVFIGIKDSKISNGLSVTSNEGENGSGSKRVSEMNFNYDAFANTSATEFIIIKTDEATGELLKEREFTIKRANGRELLSGKTDRNGVLDFGIRFATGEYLLDEVTVDGYEELRDHPITLTGDKVTEGPYAGLEVISVTNTPELEAGQNMCQRFTIKVNDPTNELEDDAKIKLTNNQTGQTYERPLNGNDEVVFDRDDLPAGEYTVTTEFEGDTIELADDFKVQYAGNDCGDEVTLLLSCPTFTLTVNENNEPVGENMKITLKKADDPSKSVTAYTDEDGKIVYEKDTLEEGTYKVYNNKDEEVGEVEVTTVPDCEATVNLDEGSIQSCPIFTLTVTDRGNNPEKDTKIVVKDANGNKVEGVDEDGNAITEFTTDENGQIKLPYVIENGTYTVFKVNDNGTETRIDTFTVTDDSNCEETVKPRPIIPPVTSPAESCDVFTITVEHDDVVVGAGVEIAIKDNEGEIATGTTNADGEIEFDDADLPEGSYTVVDKDGNDLGNITVSYEKGECQATVNLITPPVESCDFFTITVKEDGQPVGKDVEITVQDEDGEDVAQGKTDENGQVKTDEDTLPEGDYTVVDEEGNEIGSITVSYEGDCEDEVNITPPAESCDFFTITVKEDGKPVGKDVEITVQDEDGEDVARGKTDENGQVKTDEDTLPEGDYTIFDEDGEKLGIITVSYDGNCEDEVNIGTPVESCDFFTVTVKEDGKPVGKDVEVSIQDEDGNEVTPGKTNEEGKIEFNESDLPEGDYTVVDENGDKVGTITVSYDGNCEDEVNLTPPTTTPGESCEVFTLTIEHRNGDPQQEVEVFLRDRNGNVLEDKDGNTAFTTDENGKIHFDQVFEKGDYRVYEKQGKLINRFTVDPTTCEATVKPTSSGGGGGGGGPTPDPDPEDPNEPGTPGDPDPEDPNEPGTPGDPDPEDPNEPGTPGDPDPEDPNEPGTPGDPDPEDPNEPGTPGDPDPEDPSEPGKPGDPDPEDPSEPGKPGEPGTEDPNKPGTPGKPDPEDPSKPGKPGEPGQSGDSQTPGDGKPSTGSDSSDSGKEKLPQTGEELYVYMIALGAVLLATGGFVLFRRKSVR